MSNLDSYVTHGELNELMQGLLSSLDEMFARHENRIMMRIENGIGMQAKANGEAIAALQDRVGAIEDKVNTIEGKVDALSGQMTALDRKMGVMEEHVGTLTESVQYVKGKIEQFENGEIAVHVSRK